MEVGQGCPEPVEVLQFPIPKSYSRWDIRKCAGEAKKSQYFDSNLPIYVCNLSNAAQQVYRWEKLWQGCTRDLHYSKAKMS